MFAAADDHEIDALVRAHYTDVWTLCRTLVDQDEADDLAQETFMAAARALPGFRGESTVRSACRRRSRDESASTKSRLLPFTPAETNNSPNLAGRQPTTSRLPRTSRPAI